MKEFNFKKIDAFTSGNSSGNPAGYISLSPDEEISESEMQKIASELGDFVCETAFVRPLNNADADYDFRFFSKEKEVPFCGHATIAVCNELIRESENLAQKSFFKIKTQSGILRIFNESKSENSVYLEAPQPEFHNLKISHEEAGKALGININEINKSEELCCLTVGQKFLLVPFKSCGSVINYSPVFQELRSFFQSTGIEIIVIYSDSTVFKENDFRTRVFPPAFGYLEDPATGSGNAALAYHLINNRGWSKDKISIEQGISKKVPNIIKLKKSSQSVLIGGSAVARIKGKYII